MAGDRAPAHRRINVNITLLFSLEHYARVADAYLRALETRLTVGRPSDRVASVASFFVSRVDSEVDKRLEAKGGALLALRGKAAIATLQLSDTHFDEIIRDQQILGYNRYDRKIAEVRLQTLAQGLLKVAYDYVAGVEYEGLGLASIWPKEPAP